MNCVDVRPLLDTLSVDALEDEERRALEVHLAGCAGCREARDRLGRVYGLLREDACAGPALGERALRAALATVPAEEPTEQPGPAAATPFPWSDLVVGALAVKVVLLLAAPWVIR